MARIFYRTEAYRSIERVAREYASILRESHELVADVLQADIILTHVGMMVLDSHLPARARPDQKTVAYVVWENDVLPEPLSRLLVWADELWTPSQYCADIFARYHPRVKVLEHIIQAPLSSTRSTWDRRPPESVQFLAMSTGDPARKNLAALWSAFTTVAAQMPRAHLTLKTLTPPPWQGQIHGQITTICRDVPAPQARALIADCDIYVSPHHSEGWGLGMSDALACGKTVVATGYSGCLHFLNAENAILIPPTISAVDSSQHPLFTAPWANPKTTDIGEALLRAYHEHGTASAARRTHAAASTLQEFSREKIGVKLNAYVRELVSRP